MQQLLWIKEFAICVILNHQLLYFDIKYRKILQRKVVGKLFIGNPCKNSLLNVIHAIKW